VFLTHAHPDHIAGCSAFPKADIYAFAGDVKLAAGEEAAKSPMGKLAGAQPNKAIKVTKVLSDGVEVQLGELKVMPYALPGHTAGSAALLSHEVLYVGDSLTSKPDGTLVDPPWLFTEDLQQNKASIQKLAERIKSEGLSVKTIALSHSGAINGVEALLEYAKH
jgi:glyoxylase-like metal-dependent hydrolase (beta-lactamase superfamily II)